MKLNIVRAWKNAVRVKTNDQEESMEPPVTKVHELTDAELRLVTGAAGINDLTPALPVNRLQPIVKNLTDMTGTSFLLPFGK